MHFFVYLLTQRKVELDIKVVDYDHQDVIVRVNINFSSIKGGTMVIHFISQEGFNIIKRN